VAAELGTTIEGDTKWRKPSYFERGDQRRGQHRSYLEGASNVRRGSVSEGRRRAARGAKDEEGAKSTKI